MKVFRMIVQNTRTGERKVYESTRQGATPGWPYTLIAVAGYYEKLIRETPAPTR